MELAGSGDGSFRSHDKKESPVDKKAVAVWKLADGVEKFDFRHWLDTIENNLDCVHNFRFPELCSTNQEVRARGERGQLGSDH